MLPIFFSGFVVLIGPVHKPSPYLDVNEKGVEFKLNEENP